MVLLKLLLNVLKQIVAPANHLVNSFIKTFFKDGRKLLYDSQISKSRVNNSRGLNL